MTGRTLTRFTAASGLLATLLYGVVATLMADAPGTELAAPAVHAWIAAHRTPIFVAAYGFGLCAGATWCFLSGLGAVIRERGGSATLAGIAVATGYAIYAVALAGFVALLAATYRVDTLAPETVKLLDDLALLAVNLTGFPTAISMFAFAAAGRIPAWARWSASAIAVAHLISGGAVASAGWLAPSGIGVYVAPVLYYAWIAALSVVLLRGRGTLAPCASPSPAAR